MPQIRGIGQKVADTAALMFHVIFSEKVKRKLL